MSELSGQVGAFYFMDDSATTTVSDEPLKANYTLSDIVAASVVPTDHLYIANPNTNTFDVVAVASDTLAIYNITKWCSVSPKGAVSLPWDSDIVNNTALSYGQVASILVSYTYYDGAVPTGGFFSWSVDTAAEALDVTSFDGDGYKEYIAGLKGWTGSAEKYYKVTQNLGATATVVGSPGTGTTITVDDASVFSAGDIIQRALHTEIIFIKSIAGNVLTVTRGWSGTTPQSQSSGDELAVIGSVDVMDHSGAETVVRFYTDDANSKQYVGWAIVSGVSTSAPVDAVISQSLSFQGTGKLTEV